MITVDGIYPGTPSGAIFGAADGRPTDVDEGSPYRFSLHRCWAPARRPEIWLMCNPSVASAIRDDASIRRVKGYSHWWGAGGFVVVNMDPLRATDPYELDGRGYGDWYAFHNDAAIHAAIQLAARAPFHEPRRVVCAWGAVLEEHASVWERRVACVVEVAARYGVELTALATTKSGAPSHPLRLAKTLNPARWSPRSQLPEGVGETWGGIRVGA